MPFIFTGIVTKQHERVKLHITLMNTIFRRDADGVTDAKAGRDRETFSARQILEVSLKDMKFQFGNHLTRNSSLDASKSNFHLFLYVFVFCFVFFVFFIYRLFSSFY